MHRLRYILPVLVATGLWLGLTPLTGSAHTATNPVVTCDQASVVLSSFTSGTHTITFHITVNSVVSTKTTTFTSDHGTATVTISDLTTATGPLSISVYADWKDPDTTGAPGSSGTTTVTLTCHAVVPTTVVTPTTAAPAPPAPTITAKFTG